METALVKVHFVRGGCLAECMVKVLCKDCSGGERDKIEPYYVII